MQLAGLLSRHLPPPWRCMPVDQQDQTFLREVFASTKQIELSLLPTDAAMREAFIGTQMRAQHQSVNWHYPGACELILRHGEKSLGRLWLHEDASGWRLIDITIMPAHQGQGAARVVLGTLRHLADLHGHAIHLHVMADNPARHWYGRLGFETTARSGLFQAMTRIPMVALEQ